MGDSRKQGIASILIYLCICTAELSVYGHHTCLVCCTHSLHSGCTHWVGADVDDVQARHRDNVASDAVAYFPLFIGCENVVQDRNGLFQVEYIFKWNKNGQWEGEMGIYCRLRVYTPE